jgi:hypothetical protein
MAGPGRQLDADAELLRLQRRARRQFLAGQARGKAQDVLDPRRGSRLASQCGFLGQGRGQPLGCAVDGSGQAGRASAHDQQVAGPGRVGAFRARQAQRVEQREIARVRRLAGGGEQGLELQVRESQGR